jgi:hypothetical protein
MEVGSLRNYKIVLHYSLVQPGHSNIETLRLANKEFVSSPPSKRLRTEEGTEESRIKVESMPSKTDYIIKQMQAELDGFQTSPKGIRDSKNNKDDRLLNNVMFNSFNPGKYIDMYV